VTAVAPIVALLPGQILEELPAAAAGSAFTVIVTELEFTQPLVFVSVTVYTVVDVGETVAFEDVEE